MTLRHRTDSRLEAAVASFASPGVEPRYAPDLRIAPTHRDLAVAIDLDAQSVEGTLVLTVEARGPGRELRLNAMDLDVLEVEDLSGAQLTVSISDEAIDIRWPHLLLAGETAQIRVRWTVTKPAAGLVFSAPDEANPDRPRFAATDHETERARYWLPCVDHPHARPTVELRVRAEADATVLGPGAKAGEDEHADGTKTTTWRLEQPCPSYLLCFAVGEFITVDQGEHDGVPLQLFTTPDHSVEDLGRAFARADEMMAFLTERLAQPFPYPKYWQFAVPGIGGAMENISLTSWDDKFVGDERFHAERGWLVSLINLHEMAHTWFGDALGCREFAHSWLKESWATYMESVWLEHDAGDDEMLWQLHEELRAYRSEADSRYVRAISTRSFDSSWDLFDQHLYPGGAVRLHMLRKHLGDDVFWAGVQAYVADNLHQVVETADFRRSLERVSGRNLGRFFDEWFCSPGYPKLKLNWSWDSERSEGVLTVEQTQVSKARGVGLFHFDLEVAFEIEDGLWVRRTMAVGERHQALTAELPGKPLQIVPNPELAAVCSIDFQPGKMVRRSVEHASTVAGRCWAADALARKAGRKDVAALAEAALTEEHWGVRIALARALAKAQTNDAASALVAMLEQEEDPRVQGDVTLAAGRYRSAAIAGALWQWLESDERPWLARANALTALGKQRGADPVALLVSEIAGDRTAWRWVSRGAIAGLAETRVAEALAPIQEMLADGAVPERWMAARSLAAAKWQAPGLRQAAREALEAALRDESNSVRVSAVHGLAGLGEPDGARAIDDALRRFPVQDQPGARRLAGKLRTGGGDAGKVAGLNKEVQRLTDRLRKLEERLSKVEGT